MRFIAEDQLLWDAEAHFPGGQLQLLANEVDAGLNSFASLGKLEQYARLKVWIGRFRYYQGSQGCESELSEELQGLSHRVFHQLKWLSRRYEPGYIEAFRRISQPIGLYMWQKLRNCCSKLLRHADLLAIPQFSLNVIVNSQLIASR